MNHFSQLQEALQSYLETGETRIKEGIVETPSVPADTRLGIYRHAYRERLIEALVSNFPCLEMYLGSEEFHQMSLAYIAEHPSQYRSIRWYGNELAAYLIDYYESDYSFLAELAEFEWKLTLAFDAEDAPHLSLEEITKLPPESWENMRLKNHPSLQRMNFFWETVKLWEDLNQDNPLVEMKKNPQATPWVLWRHERLQHFYALAPDEAWALDSLIQGHSFGELCQGLCLWHEEEKVGMRAASLLKTWIESGLISELHVAG